MDLISEQKTPYKEEEIKNILHPAVNSWFFSRFREFSLPQKFGILNVHNRINTLISAPTGATKTLTAFLAIINELVDLDDKGILENRIYAIYISPLKALNNDIEKNLREPLAEIQALMQKKSGVRVAVRTGDTTVTEKSRMLAKPPHILITTPESVAILLSSEKFVEHLKHVDWCIIDEIHALAENKRGTHLSISMERLQSLSPGMVRIGLSATIAPLQEVAHYLVGKGRPCRIIDVQFIKNMDLKVLSPVPDLIETDYETLHKSLYSLMHELLQAHKTTLIFTNTRSATERVVDNLKFMYPLSYNDSNIGAHHGSLSKEHRLFIENSLREGKLKAVVSSTSLELGIDIGFIDLVICLGSPKSVARVMQRLGRSGHKLHDTTKGRLLVLNRDDLVECSVMLKSAIEKKIDRIHIPTNCLDVLAQQIIGIAVASKIHIDDLHKLITQSYCFESLDYSDFKETLYFLAGRYTSLEERHIYARIWYDEDTGMIGRKGRLGRVVYMTNVGTIPEESFITVKVGTQVVGFVDEAFLEHLKRGDVFVLGGNKYEFLFARGMVAQVSASVQRPPTIPSWFSEMLPLSFDLAMDIQRLRKLLCQRFSDGDSREDILKFIKDYLYLDANAAVAIYSYFEEQHKFSKIPHEKRIIIEHYDDKKRKYAIFHTLFGRRVNNCLSRALALAIARTQHRDVEIGVNDNGFYLATEKSIMAMRGFKLLKSSELRKVSELAIERTEILKRRFRHCATRSLMILRNYAGVKKRVGRQQVSSMILINAVRRVSNDFPILKEARREVLEDLMDIGNATKVLEMVEEGTIKVEEVTTTLPSPFAFELVLEGYVDLLKMQDRIEFLKKMHQMVKEQIS